MMGLKHRIMQRLRAWCQACQKRELERQKERLAELKAEEKRLLGKLFTVRLMTNLTTLTSQDHQKPPGDWDQWINGEAKH